MQQPVKYTVASLMFVIDKAIDLQIRSDGPPQRLHPANVSIDQRLD